MEVEPSSPVVAKKLWHLIRIVFFMLRKGLSKSNKLLLDLNMLLKRGKLAGKAITNNLIMLHHSSSAFSCRSNDAISFVTPREYEFSCSNSPAIHTLFKRSNKYHFSKYSTRDTAATYQYQSPYQNEYDDVNNVAAVQRVLEMLAEGNYSPMVTVPGFGKSPMVRQLRITDSPFPMKEEEGENKVDKESEEFIKKFYQDLKSEKRRCDIESPFRALRSR